MNHSITWLCYPLIILITSAAQLSLLYQQTPHWLLHLGIASMGLLSVDLLERVHPHEEDWNHDHNDTMPDILHALFSLGLIFASTHVVQISTNFLPTWELWFHSESWWLQVLVAGLIIDFGLWFMHWASHRVDWLWKIHALHHSSKRLYRLNGEKRHPLSALVLSLPGVLVCTLMGVPAEVTGVWFAIVSVHLAFQHANINYRLGIFNRVLSVAEVHRWHHYKHDTDRQYNFGEFWMFWDLAFGTYRPPERDLYKGEIGLIEPMPESYTEQLKWPFKQK